MRRFTKIILFIFLSSCLASFTANAQSLTDYDLRGYVFKKGSTDHLAFANIISKTKRQGTISDDKGKFRVSASKGDTILFSYVGYKNFQLIVTDSIISQRNTLIIEMEAIIYELSPVTVRNFYDLPGFIRREAQQDTMQIIGLPNINRQPYNPLNYYKSSLGFGNNGIVVTGLLTALLKNFDKHFIQLRKLEEIKARDQQWFAEQKLYEDKFNKEFVAKITQLEGKDLDQFMDMFKPPVVFLSSANEYDLTIYLKENLNIYQRLKRGQR